MKNEWIDSLTRGLLEAHPLREMFHLPVIFDLGAVFFFALTGALAGIRRGYDFIGMFIMAFVAGVGGALIRDGLFIQQGPPAVVLDGRYLVVVALACLAGMVIGGFIERFQKVIAYIDALGLGAYAVVGVQKALSANMSIPAAIMIGTINAVGGGLLRDIIVRVEPLTLKPGQFYILAALLGCGLFVGLILGTSLSASQSALSAIAVTFVFRVLAIRFNWQTRAVRPWFAGHGKETTMSSDETRKQEQERDSKREE
ncbi:MAG TPA: TRIC cation channel family protein [Candidatus Methylomirabilis sp.]|nr:TRIC cation channel family protein [Candidatus Methylomirabilis sp.]